MDFSISLDTQSIQELVRLQGFSALLNPEIQQALIQSGQMLVQDAQDNTWQVFDNPTGVLANSIYFYVAGPQQVEARVGVPYGRRREYGFVGMVDSLGRVGTDRARPYLQPAVDQDTAQVQELIASATNTALGRVAVG